jgi:hypothetical protein
MRASPPPLLALALALAALAAAQLELQAALSPLGAPVPAARRAPEAKCVRVEDVFALLESGARLLEAPASVSVYAQRASNIQVNGGAAGGGASEVVATRSGKCPEGFVAMVVQNSNTNVLPADGDSSASGEAAAAASASGAGAGAGAASK